jgi:hypothetical protein
MRRPQPLEFAGIKDLSTALFNTRLTTFSDSFLLRFTQALYSLDGGVLMTHNIGAVPSGGEQHE